MNALLRYEFRKTISTKTILLGLTVVAEAVFLYGLYSKKDSTLSIGVVLLVLLAIFGMMMMGVSSILSLHRDMNTKQSYMLFMTPNSSYKILGAKMIENGLSLLLGGAFFFALGLLDIRLLFQNQLEVRSVYEMATSFIEQMFHGITIDAKSMLCVAIYLIATWIGTITTAYLSDVISAALLNGKKYNSWVTFLIFLVINYVMGKIVQMVAGIMNANLLTELLCGSTCYLVLSLGMYVITAKIMEDKLSV